MAAFVAKEFQQHFGRAATGVCFRECAIVATFMLGMFWKRTTGHGAFWGRWRNGRRGAHYGLTLPAERFGSEGRVSGRFCMFIERDGAEF